MTDEQLFEIKNYNFYEEPPEYQEEVHSLLREICERYKIAYPGIEENEIAETIFYQDLMNISRKYRSCPLPSCEIVVADNLYFGRKIIGLSIKEIAQIAGIPLQIVKEYEAAKRKIWLHKREFIKLSYYYGYTPDNFKEIFIYGSQFHILFSGYPFWPEIETLSLCNNPFYDK